jgi:hypothetical protein
MMVRGPAVLTLAKLKLKVVASPNTPPEGFAADSLVEGTGFEPSVPL